MKEIKEYSNISIRVPVELVRETQQIRNEKGTNWSFEIKTFLERRVEELKSQSNTAKAQ